MNSIDSLLTYFNNIIPLTDEETSFVKSVFQEKKVRKRQFILQQGDICKLNTFIVEGCFKMYLVDPEGKEHNLQFGVENWWIGDIASFHHEEPSQLYIEALEHSTVLQIKKADQWRMFTEHPKFNQIFRVFTENALVATQRRVLQNIGSTAQERYVDFCKRHPYFLNRISNVQIASYLGVTPEFLSTIRKKIVQQ